MIEQKHKLTDTGDVKVHDNAIKSITKLTVSKINGVVRIDTGALKSILDNIGIGKALNIMDGIRVESSEWHRYLRGCREGSGRGKTGCGEYDRDIFGRSRC